MPTFGVFRRQIPATGGDDIKRPSKREVFWHKKEQCKNKASFLKLIEGIL